MAGIAEAIYLGGYTFEGPPSACDPEYQDAKEEQRLADGTLVTHGLWPEDGDSDLLNKVRWSLSWEGLSDADELALARFTARLAAMDFCPWFPIVEEWTFAAGESYAGILR